MDVFKYIVIFILYFVFSRGEENINEDNDKSQDREGKQLLDKLEHGGWKTVSPNWQGTDDWIPQNNQREAENDYLEKPTRRRRIRKRKRRPPSEDLIRRNDNSHTLQDTHDTWMQMDENSHEPHNRRRIIPAYTSEELPKAQHVYEKVRDPFTALQEVEAKSRLKKKPTGSETTTPSLKELLKQTANGLSLSEILQRKNLSLADLLKGKQQAISALTERMEISTEPVPVSTTESLNLETHSTSLKTYDVISEPTTERRVFIPSYPKIMPFSYKTSTVRTSTASDVISSTIVNKYSDYRSKYMSLKPKLQNMLPATRPKLHKLSSTVQSKNEFLTTETPLKPFTIDIKDLFGYSTLTTTKKYVSTEDEPMRMVINMKGLIKQDHPIPTTVKTVQNNSNKNFEKLKPLNAREELMEVLKDQMSRQNLARILQDRNMTIEELVAQRERGSSQIHLADIFHNQTREPEPPSEPHIGTITSYMERKPKTFKNQPKTSNESNYLDTVVQLKSLSADLDNKSSNAATSFPTYKIAVDKILKQNEVPFQHSIWKTLYPHLYSESNSEKKDIEQAKVDEILKSEVRRIEEIENTISEAVNNKLNVDLVDNTYENEENFMRIPNGVKSAIIASTVVVGISLLVFLTILITCKLSHKKKKRLCYSDVYSSSKIRSPILETRPKRTIRTIMNETLGRKKKFSNLYPQNISDYFWENDKKPFQ